MKDSKIPFHVCSAGTIYHDGRIPFIVNALAKLRTVKASIGSPRGAKISSLFLKIPELRIISESRVFGCRNRATNLCRLVRQVSNATPRGLPYPGVGTLGHLVRFQLKRLWAVGGLWKTRHPPTKITSGPSHSSSDLRASSLRLIRIHTPLAKIMVVRYFG